jgi:hypothetical protein
MRWKFAARQLLLIGLLTYAISPVVAASAADPKYPAMIATSCSVNVSHNAGGTYVAHFAVQAGVGQPQGTASAHVNGRQTVSKALVNGKADITLPANLATGQTHRLLAKYNPADSSYSPCRATLKFWVAGVHEAAAPGEAPAGASLPNTGGFRIQLLFLALGLLIGGGALVASSRRPALLTP